jgi:hypothetical protein
MPLDLVAELSATRWAIRAAATAEVAPDSPQVG